MDLWKKVTISVFSLATMCGAIYVSYKAGEKSEKARYDGYIKGREDQKSENKDNIHNLDRIIDKSLFRAEVSKSNPAYSKILKPKEKIDRFWIRNEVENTDNQMEKIAKLIGIIDRVGSLYDRGVMTAEECLDAVGEVNAQKVEIEKVVPISGEIKEAMAILEEDILISRKTYMKEK